jgi:hypothetical protein
VQQLPEQIAERYGKSPKQEAQKRQAVIIAASVVGALFIVWAVWANLTTKNEPPFKTGSFEIIDASNLSVSFVLSKPANSSAVCAVQALKEDYGVVAYKEVTIPVTSPEDGSIMDVPIKVSLRSTELAVTGLVDRCWYE